MTLTRAVARHLSILIFTAGSALALAASLAGAYALARATPRIGFLVGAVLVGFFLCVLLVAALASLIWKAHSRGFSLITSTILTALLGLILYSDVLRPTRYHGLAAVTRSNTQYTRLATGSRIAYSVYPPAPGVPAKADPIVFLHGGPGIRAYDSDHAFYRQFARDGFKVYLFHQAGSGLSDRLPHATDYTMERFVADLEALRQQFGAERMILIGHSWGGTLAAHYAAAYPGRVSKLVFHSPGPIWTELFIPFEFQRTAAGDDHRSMPLRIVAALALSYANPAASEQLVPQTELGDWAAAAGNPRELVCKAQSNDLPREFSGSTTSGINMYPLIVITQELKQKKMDVRGKLRTLHIPAIALEGQCDFIPWGVHSQYRRSIAGLQEYYFENAGHFINFSQPERMATVIRSFLLDQPPAFPPYPGDQDPRPPILKPPSR